MFKRIVFPCLIGLLISTSSAYADIWSAVDDFPTVTSSTSPYNGAWAYGYASTLNPVNFTPDATATPDYFGDGKAAGFYTATTGPYSGNVSYNLPTVLKNISGGNLNESSINSWPTDVLLMHPGPNADYSVVQFTAPSTATYQVTGYFTALDIQTYGVTNDSVSLTSGGSSTLLYSATSRTNPQNTFNFDLSLTAGQSLDFAVGLGPGNQFYNDSTGFAATITTPEPGAYGVLVLGLGGLLAAVRRRKKA